MSFSNRIIRIQQIISIKTQRYKYIIFDINIVCIAIYGVYSLKGLKFSLKIWNLRRKCKIVGYIDTNNY